MIKFVEPSPLVSINEITEYDQLGESVSNSDYDAIRVFEPKDTFIVIGRHQKPEKEIFIDEAKKDGINIYRRVTGGGTVVLSKGMLVVALRMARDKSSVSEYFEAVNSIMIKVIAENTNATPKTKGHGDLAILQEDGSLKKILGASLRQSKDYAYYLGVLLISDSMHFIDKYLAFPSRQPDYREERKHSDFCASLDKYAGDINVLKKELYDKLTAIVVD